VDSVSVRSRVEWVRRHKQFQSVNSCWSRSAISFSCLKSGEVRISVGMVPFKVAVNSRDKSIDGMG